jgi:methionyl-tRNA formyltransferase
MRIIFAGDRDISVWVLEHLLQKGIKPLALLVSDETRASHAESLREKSAFLDDQHVFVGKAFREPSSQQFFASLNLDYIICIHFPYIVPESVLNIPRHGVINLHPAYLPYNRGWHTPSWALLENTPIGATLHFMEAGLDTGDIIHQKQLNPAPDDTAHSLYQKLKLLEFEVFKEALPGLIKQSYQRMPQAATDGTAHKRAELYQENIQKIDLDETVLAGELIQKLRALTTNDITEAAYFVADGKKYRIQISIQEDG